MCKYLFLVNFFQGEKMSFSTCNPLYLIHDPGLNLRTYCTTIVQTYNRWAEKGRCKQVININGMTRGNLRRQERRKNETLFECLLNFYIIIMPSSNTVSDNLYGRYIDYVNI